VYKAAVQLSIDINVIGALIAGLTGQRSLAQQVLALVIDPIIGGVALAEAINLAVAFYSRPCRTLATRAFRHYPDRVRSRWPWGI
jgi:hypothetical protein